MDEFVKKVKSYISENALTDKGDKVVIGVSGGADSVALLYSLFDLSKELDLKLYVVHINHGLRSEAKAEAEYVRTLSEGLGVPFFLYEEDVESVGKKLSIGTEEAGRKIRYERFYEVLKKTGASKIAVAHNKNDLCETMLFNLFRGTGIKGLASIPPKRGEIIRPLLCTERSEIEEFLNRQQVSFCIDASNLTNDYSRNRIRNVIIPAIKEYAANEAVSHMAECAKQLRELYTYVDDLAGTKFEECLRLKSENTVSLDKKRLTMCDAYVQKLLVKKMIDALVPSNKDITHTHLEEVCVLLKKPGSKRANLPYGITAVSDYETLTLTKELPKDAKLPEIKFEIIDNFEGFDYGDKKYTKCFDYDKIRDIPFVRFRESKDFIVINKDGNKKRLKDFMINEKIPAALRDTTPLLVKGNDVLWVMGYRMSEAYKVTKDTKKILRATLFKED